MLLNSKPINGSEKLVKIFIKLLIPIALVSSISVQSFKLKVKANKWLELFKVRVLRDDALLTEGKPSLQPYLLAA